MTRLTLWVRTSQAWKKLRKLAKKVKPRTCPVHKTFAPGHQDCCSASRYPIQFRDMHQ